MIQSDSWRTVLSFNFIGPILKTYIIALDGRFFNVLGLFVIGLWAGQQLLLNNIHENRPFLIRVAAVGLLLGIPLNIFLAMENPTGLGLGKYLGSALLTLTVFIIFGIQIVISTLWLKRYRFGPLEWIWRVLTYGRYMKNRLE